MALFGLFGKKDKTVRCDRCGDRVLESDTRPLSGKVYCSACYGRVSAAQAAAQDVRSGSSRSASIVEEASASPTSSHPAIRDIEKSFIDAKIKHKTTHVGNQWEVAAGFSADGHVYLIKFISKDDSKNDVAVRVFALAHCPDSRLPQMRRLLNQLQDKYRYVSLSLDKDNDINVEYDFPACTPNPGAVAMEMVIRVSQIVDDIYPQIKNAL